MNTQKQRDNPVIEAIPYGSEGDWVINFPAPYWRKNVAVLKREDGWDPDKVDTLIQVAIELLSADKDFEFCRQLKQGYDPESR